MSAPKTDGYAYNLIPRTGNPRLRYDIDESKSVILPMRMVLLGKIKCAIGVMFSFLACTGSSAVFFVNSSTTSVTLAAEETREFSDLPTYWYPESITRTTTAAHIFKVTMPADEEVKIQIKCSSLVSGSFIGIDYFDHEPTTSSSAVYGIQCDYNTTWIDLGSVLSKGQLGKTWWIRFHYEKQDVGYGAKYNNKLSIRFYRGTGEGSAVLPTVTVSFVNVFGQNIPPREYTIGTPYGTLPVPTQSGYEFIGWYASASSTKQILATTAASADCTTLYAKWTPINYKVKFNANGPLGKCESRLIVMADQRLRLSITQMAKNTLIFQPPRKKDTILTAGIPPSHSPQKYTQIIPLCLLK